MSPLIRSVGLRRGGSFAPPIPAGIVTAGLVAEYRFDEGSGLVLTDYAGGHDGALDRGSPTWAPDGLVFAGNDAVSVPHHAAFNVSAVTLELWARITNATGFSGGVAKGAVFGSPNQYEYSLHFANGNASFAVSSGTTSSSGANALGGVDLNAWTCWLGRYDGAKVSIWKNGVKIAENAFGGPIGLTSYEFGIGGRSQPFGADSNVYGLKGKLGRVHVYNRGLSDAEVSANFRALRAQFGV